MSKWLVFLTMIAVAGLSGCAAIPDVRHQPTFHNPFPQLHRVAILPFFNLSEDPTVDQDAVAEAYYEELQKIPGFEVVPPGVVKTYLLSRQIQIDQRTDMQRLARDLGVDALIRGAVTKFDAYYPPKMGMSVEWFAANPSFHQIPPGYGLPWGTPEEEYIPDSLVYEAEFALAREQLDTQTPDVPGDQLAAPLPDAAARYQEPLPLEDGSSEEIPLPPMGAPGPDLPLDWPDPRGFVPPPPAAERPQPRPQYGPVITHTELYDSADVDFTERLANYFFFKDDARFGGWQAYLERTDDFIRFCCYLHIGETLAARGGAGKTRVVWRWPIDRYLP